MATGGCRLKEAGGHVEVVVVIGRVVVSTSQVRNEHVPSNNNEI